MRLFCFGGGGGGSAEDNGRHQPSFFVQMNELKLDLVLFRSACTQDKGMHLSRPHRGVCNARREEHVRNEDA